MAVFFLLLKDLIMTEYFQQDPERQEQIGFVYDLLVSRFRGDVIDWEHVDDVLGFSHDSDLGRYVVGEARGRLLEEDHIATRCDRAIGVRLLTAKEQVTTAPADRMRRAKRQLNRGIKEVVAVPVEEIEDPLDLRIRNATIESMDRESTKLAQASRGLPRFPTHPIRQVQEN